MTSTSRHIHFVTGRLAESSLRDVVEPLAREHGFQFTIDVLPITVAALMTPQWVARHWKIPEPATEILLPGYCNENLDPLTSQTTLPIQVGPRDLRALPQFFGSQNSQDRYGGYAIEIIAEINHAPRLSFEQLRNHAETLRRDGADVIDLGCIPGQRWSDAGAATRMLREAGFRVSIDSFEPAEIQAATDAGAELVLSVNQANRDAAADWNATVVAIPDTPDDLASLDETIDRLEQTNVAYRLDPILEPIGFGFARSLNRYWQTRRRYPQAEMMMGVGNLTELTDVDSAGLNVLLLAVCEEWQIGSVLTTQVINWARTSVRECDRARRLVHHAIENRTLPKHVDSSLIALRDERLYRQGRETLVQLAGKLRDSNYRIFAEDGIIHLISAKLHLSDRDPYALLQQLLARNPKHLDASHAFYLGFEMSKAATALVLGKNYVQDQPLDWGALVRPEESIDYEVHRARRDQRDSADPD